MWVISACASEVHASLRAAGSARGLARSHPAQAVYAEIVRTLKADDSRSGGGADAAFTAPSGELTVVETFGFIGFGPSFFGKGIRRAGIHRAAALFACAAHHPSIADGAGLAKDQAQRTQQRDPRSPHDAAEPTRTQSSNFKARCARLDPRHRIGGSLLRGPNYPPDKCE